MPAQCVEARRRSGAGVARWREDYDNKYVGNEVKGDERMAKEGLRAGADIKFHDNSVMKLRVSGGGFRAGTASHRLSESLQRGLLFFPVHLVPR